MYRLFLWRLFVSLDFVRLRLQLNLWFWTRPCATPRDFPPWGQPSVQQQLAGYCCHRSVHQGRPQIMRWLGSGFVEIGLEYVRFGRSGASRAFVALRVQDVVCTGSSRGWLWNTLLILIVAEAHRRERVNPQLCIWSDHTQSGIIDVGLAGGVENMSMCAGLHYCEWLQLKFQKSVGFEVDSSNILMY